MVGPCPTCGHVDVPVVRRVEIRPKPAPSAPPPGVIEMDDRAFRDRKLRGDIAPGIYRLRREWNREWQETVSIPSRVPVWVRSPQGWLWHRIRMCEIWWRTPVSNALRPSMHVSTWCGPMFSSSRYVKGRAVGRRLEFADDPCGERCAWCDTQEPDVRRLPDALASTGGVR